MKTISTDDALKPSGHYSQAIYQAFRKNAPVVEQVENLGTEAEGIAIARPMRGDESLEAVKKSGGEIWASRESDLAPTLTKNEAIGLRHRTHHSGDVRSVRCASYPTLPGSRSDAVVWSWD